MIKDENNNAIYHINKNLNGIMMRELHERAHRFNATNLTCESQNDINKIWVCAYSESVLYTRAYSTDQLRNDREIYDYGICMESEWNGRNRK